MADSQAYVVGRDLELAVVEHFVLSCHEGPASLVLEGAAGIGKTAIWMHSVVTAKSHGVVVMSSRCGESDAGWTFAGLGDLLDGVNAEVAAGLPPGSAAALAAAMLTDGGQRWFLGRTSRWPSQCWECCGGWPRSDRSFLRSTTCSASTRHPAGAVLRVTPPA